MRRLAALLVLLLLAEGCGIKGPLYIPTAEQKRQAEARKQRREAAMQRNAGKTPAAAKVDAASAPTVAEPEEKAPDPSILQPGEDPFGLSTPTQDSPLP